MPLFRYSINCQNQQGAPLQKDVILILDERVEAKMKMKKLLCLALAVFMSAAVLAGCNSTNAGGKVEKAEDLEGKRVGVQEGTTGDTYVFENYTKAGRKELQTKLAEDGETVSLLPDTFQDATINRFKKVTDAALDLKNGKVDAVVVDEMPAKMIVAANTDLKILDIALTEEEYSIAVKKGDTKMLQDVNAALKTLKENGVFDKLVSKWIENDESVQLPEIPKYTSKGTLVMGTNAEFSPFEFHADDGTIVGFDVDLATYIAAELEMELKIEDMNFDSLIGALQSSKVDFVAAGMTADAERRKNVDFSDSYYSASQVIIVKK